MVPDSDHTFQVGQSALMITAFTSPRRSSVRLCLTGEIDLADSALLSTTVEWLCHVQPTVVLVDLSGVTYAGSALPNFVAEAHQQLPDGTNLILWRAGPAADLVLRATSMDVIATLTDDPPAPRPADAADRRG